MKFIYSCQTDAGMVREKNQDALVVKSLNIRNHTVLLAAVCDGVGGLSQGELTSRKAAEMLSVWFDYELPQIMNQPQEEEILHYRFRQLMADINKEVYYSNCRCGVSSATTLTALLVWDYQYLIAHVGDSRIYRIGQRAVQLTRDHSWVAQEVAMGRMTMGEAERDSRQNVILKCIGAEPDVEPDIFEGSVRERSVFILCTDGFWHHVKPEEWVQWFAPAAIRKEGSLGENLYHIVNEVKQRGESDNITAIAIYIF